MQRKTPKRNSYISRSYTSRGTWGSAQNWTLRSNIFSSRGIREETAHVPRDYSRYFRQCGAALHLLCRSLHTEFCAAAVLIRIRSNATYTNSQKARAFFVGLSRIRGSGTRSIIRVHPYAPLFPFVLSPPTTLVMQDEKLCAVSLQLVPSYFLLCVESAAEMRWWWTGVSV